MTASESESEVRRVATLHTSAADRELMPIDRSEDIERLTVFIDNHPDWRQS